MRPRQIITGTLVLALCLAAAATSRADGGAPPPPGGQPPAGQPAAPGAKDAEAAAYLKELGAQVGKQADEDAKKSIAKLVEYGKDKDVSDATKKLIADALERYAKEEKSSSVTVSAIDALGQLPAAVAAPPLIALLDRTLKAKDPVLDVYGTCLRSLKNLADTRPATLKYIEDLLKFKTDDVVSRTAEAMSGYGNAPGKVKKELLEELIKQTEGVSSGAKNPKNSALTKKWNLIQSNVRAAFKALSGQDFQDAEAARKWFNDHKKDAIWDK